MAQKLRTMAVESGAISVPTFVPVDQSNLKKENIVLFLIRIIKFALRQ